jgi:hypothetical protein
VSDLLHRQRKAIVRAQQLIVFSALIAMLGVAIEVLRRLGACERPVDPGDDLGVSAHVESIGRRRPFVSPPGAAVHAPLGRLTTDA